MAGAPSVSDVLAQFLEFIGDSPLAAHNASFDIKFIEHLIRGKLSNKIHCSLKLSRKAFPGLENYKLATVAMCLDIGIKRTHRAYEDALCAGYIYMRCIQKLSSFANINPVEKPTKPVKTVVPIKYDVLDFDEFERYVHAFTEEAYAYFDDCDDIYNVNHSEAMLFCFVVPFHKYCKNKGYSTDAIKIIQSRLNKLVGDFADELAPYISERISLVSEPFQCSQYEVFAETCADLIFGSSRDSDCVEEIVRLIESPVEVTP